MKIIPYENKYFDGVRSVCFNTASSRYKENEEILYLLYADYYLEHEKDNCFIVVNDDDEVVGYILSCLNYKKYIKIFKKEYFKKIKNISKEFVNEARYEIFHARLHGNKYPSHLHIDILPLYQKMGLGKELINTLKNHLISESVNGVTLSCGYQNKGAQAFYQKMGFKVLSKSRMLGVSFGLLLRR